MDIPDHVIYVELYHSDFGVIPCKPIYFNGSLKDAKAAGKAAALKSKEEMGAEKCRIRIIS